MLGDGFIPGEPGVTLPGWRRGAEAATRRPRGSQLLPLEARNQPRADFAPVHRLRAPARLPGGNGTKDAAGGRFENRYIAVGQMIVLDLSPPLLGALLF